MTKLIFTFLLFTLCSASFGQTKALDRYKNLNMEIDSIIETKYSFKNVSNDFLPENITKNKPISTQVVHLSPDKRILKMSYDTKNKPRSNTYYLYDDKDRISEIKGSKSTLKYIHNDYQGKWISYYHIMDSIVVINDEVFFEDDKIVAYYHYNNNTITSVTELSYNIEGKIATRIDEARRNSITEYEYNTMGDLFKETKLMDDGTVSCTLYLYDESFESLKDELDMTNVGVVIEKNRQGNQEKLNKYVKLDGVFAKTENFITTYDQFDNPEVFISRGDSHLYVTTYQYFYQGN